jgi:outer membrane receptor protein involved in Fe transport
MKASTKNHKSRLQRGAATVAIGVAIISGQALAQETDSSAIAPATEAQSDENIIIVTGSRIARPDLAASSPVAIVSAEAIKQNNTVTVEDILKSNPQFSAAFGSTSNNPGDGSATVNLRGLDVTRTLVLVDGKRAPTYDTQGAVDVNSIPTALIKRIDVLTGGASAVYGSDAIAGVVNFILDDRFEGLQADGSSQITSRGDGALYDLSLTGGLALGDRGNIVVSGGYSKRNGIKYAARPHNRRTLDSSDLVSSGGSSNAVPTIFDLTDRQVQITDSGVLSDDLQLYEFTPVNYAQLPFERYNVMALGRYELTDAIELYGRANYSHIKVTQTLAPTATAGFTFNIDPSNPFLTPDEQAVFFGPTAFINDGSDPAARAGTSVIGIRRRIVETGGRIEINKTENMQFVGGLKGDLGESMHWDVFAQYGQSKKSRDFLNDLSYTALTQALDVVSGPSGPQCFDPSGGCVPLNLFTTGTIPQSQLAFVLRNGREDTKITQFVAGGALSGDVTFLKSPWADKPAAFSVGAEYRREKGTTAVDANYGSGDLIYYGQGQNISGKYDVKEVYAELKVPLVQDRPFIYALNLEGGFRYSDYSTVGTVYTYKAGGDWSPSEGFRFRGIYQRAVRAPNIYELYSPVVAGTGSLSNDPCAGPGVSSTIAALCIAQGARPESIGTIPQPISGQINIFTGGNPDLDAEKSDTYTIGLVINPPSMRRFSFSIDYFNINIANAIDDTPPFITVDQCFNVTKDATSAACQGIVRNTLTGSLSGATQFGVASVLGNIASIKTDGVDVTASYRGGEAEAFNWGISAAGTYTRHYKKKADPTAASTECAGRFGSACNIEPIAKWKHVVNVNLGFKGVNFVTRWRYFGKVKQDVGTDILKSRIPAFNYFDETVSFDVNDAFTLRLGVQNVFDKKSPIVGDTVGADPTAGGTYPNTYDVIGRTLFAGATVKF